MRIVYNRIGSIASSACNIGYNCSLFTRNFVYKRGFADIWLTNNRNFNNIFIRVVKTALRDIFDDLIKKVTRSVSVNRRYRYRIAESQIIEFIKFRRKSTYIINLIYAENYRLTALLQH